MSRRVVGESTVRAQLVLMSARGATAPEIAEALNLSAPTVRRWLHRFNADGAAGLVNRNTLMARRADHSEKEHLEQMQEQASGLLSKRAQAILLSQRRYAAVDIADIVGVCSATVRQWIHRYNREGVAGLYNRKPRKRSSAVSSVLVKLGLISALKHRFNGKSKVAQAANTTVLAEAKAQSQIAFPEVVAKPKDFGAAHNTAQSLPAVIGSRLLTLDSTLVHGMVLAAIFGLAIGLRIVHINAIGYNSDEAVYAGQGAAIARVPILSDIFPVFRAHPLLFQFTLALFFNFFGAIDWLGRLVSAAVGIATVYLVYRLGRRLYGPKAGLIAALFMALMPYHVVVTRQVLLDGPMALFSTLTLWLMVRFAETKRPVWLYAAGAGMGLTFLAKETGILMIGAIYAFLALSPQIRVRIRDIFVSLATMILVMLPFPLSLSLSGGGSERSASQYLIWQLFRRPNHTWDFYLTEVPPAIGVLVFAAAFAGLLLLRRSNGWRERLLVLWIIVPFAFFQLWPTKGFQYLLPTAPAVALLAARMLSYWPTRDLAVRNLRIPRILPGLLLTLVIAVTLFSPSWERILPSQSDTFLAGSGGIPGGRETGNWIRQNVPKGSIFMTIGPSMANIVKFYGHEEAFGLSVSPNPLHRNPSYEPIYNPDFDIRTGELQYLVWDSFSAGRTTFFSDKLLWYVQKYNGRAVYTETVTVTTPEGATVEKPVIIIYRVHP